MGVILKGGTIVTSTKTYKSDIRIENEKIVEINEKIELKDAEVIDIEGCFIIPGGIDPHTHFDMNAGSTITADDFYTGTKAAIMGGTTTVLDFAECDEGDNLSGGLVSYKKKSENKCYCDYGFHMTITKLDEDTFTEMEELVDKGVTSFKLYMAYKDVLQVDDGVIYKVLKKAKELGCVVALHCENGDLLDVLIKETKQKGNLSPKYHPFTRPNLLEKEAVSRLIDITKLTKATSYIVHISCKEALENVKLEKESGVNIVVETCPQYLLLDDSLYEKDGFEGAKYVMSPPLRKKEDIDYLWEGINNGDIQTVGTDHCSFNYKNQKELGREDFSKIPNGAPGVEHRILLLYTYGVLENKITLNKLVEVTSTNPAKVFGMYPQKGEIELGSDADLAIINPNKEEIISYKTHNQNVDYTPYEGFKVKCSIEHVFLRGNHVVKDCKLNNLNLLGKFIKRKTIR